MDIKEIQLLTGLSQDEINFYDREGLICIDHNLNLNKEDIEQLRYIKLLLKLEIPISKIKKFSSKKISLKSVLKEKIKEFENNKINIDGKIYIAKDILKSIKKKKNIYVNEYLEELECIEKGQYAEIISDLDSIKERSLIFQIFITINCLTPIMWFYLKVAEKNYNKIGFIGTLSILTTIVLTLTWKSYLQQKNKKIGGTLSYILAIILVLILTFLILIGIDWLQFRIFIPDEYLMYVFKAPYSNLIFLFEVEVFIITIAILGKITKVNLHEYEWAYNLLRFIKRNVIKVVVINIILLYICVTDITVITKDRIIDYNFYNPMGIEYTYNDITKINTGFLGKKKPLYGNKGDFYYEIRLKNKRQIALSDAISDFDDTYLELEIFDKLVAKKSNVQKISSKENYKLCDIDKIYVERCLRIIEN